MSYIKKLVMQGFKSFARKTELPFTPGINTILGPNGSGKSNVTDALCFVLGRLSIKSMRAAKASNLIFLGTKAAAPAKEAYVELILDNEEKVFSMDEKEISVKRILRKNGQSLYKINGKTKTRQEVLSLLAEGGIDPNGFNIILQGEIQNFVKMQGEERRKVIEEVAGISIYEARKEKSLKELEKTEEKLKEVSAILKERTIYLNNLEKERQAALKHQKLKEDIQKFKKSIIHFDLTNKKKDKKEVLEKIEGKNKEVEKIRKVILTYRTNIENFEDKISEINSLIQKQTGLEQEKLNQEIANLRADIAGLSVKKEGAEKKLKEISRQRINYKEVLEENELSIKELQEESPTVEKIQKELKIKKKELEILEEKRKKHYTFKSELKSLRERIEDKKSIFQNYENENKFLIKQIENLSLELFDKRTTTEKVEELKLSLVHKKEILENLDKRERELEKISHTNEYEIEQQKKVIEKIEKLDICPLCKNKITSDHIHSINEESGPKISKLKEEIKRGFDELREIKERRTKIIEEVEIISSEIQKRQSDLIKIRSIFDKNEQVKLLQSKFISLKEEISKMENKKNSFESAFDDNSNIEEKYDSLRLEIEEISLRNKENLSSEISFKQREIERTAISLKQLDREEKDLEEELNNFRNSLLSKEKELDKKRKDEEELTKKAEKYINERDSIQYKIREQERELMNKNNFVHNLEIETNNFKVELARVDAEIENFETEILEYSDVEIIRSGRETIVQKLRTSEEMLARIGNVNLRALEVYDEIKKEYDTISERVEVIEHEKEKVLKIIQEIDIKKKRSFLKTLEELNEIFTRNFAQISTKGQVTLDLENKKTPFEGGVNIIVKTGHGKYFDVKSLSGGEQTMVALSLIFAIQELKPYYFYILDEIDAALDKRNSERLAGLLKKYMQKGQYIVITHNDEIITNATNLFGVSMHEGISKVISLKA